MIRADLTPDDLYYLIWERGIVARACDKQSSERYARHMDYTLRGLRAHPMTS